MDVFTHFLVPYAAALAVLGFHRRARSRDGDAGKWEARAAWAAAFGIAGVAPDVDVVTDGLSERVDALYWLQHRGFSHTLIGAPFHGLAVLGVLAAVARVWPRTLRLLRWRRAFWLAGPLGAWTHLLLDLPTLAGVPLLWPLSFTRYTLPPYHWLVWWLFPVGGLAAILHVIGRLPRHRVVQVGAVFVALLAATAGVRVVTYPGDVDEDARVFPRRSAFEWIVVTPAGDDAWNVTLLRDGDVASTMTFTHEAPPDAADAVARARDTPAYRGFLMGQYGPVTVNATSTDEGAWNVTFTDVAQRFEALHDPSWTPVRPHDEWGYVAFIVDADAVEVTHRGW